MRANVFLREYTTKKGETRRTLIVREYGQRDRSICLGPVSKKTAQECRLQTLHELMSGTFRREPTVHLYFSEFLERFFADFAKGTRSPRTVVLYGDLLKAVLKRFKGWRLQQIHKQDIEGHLAEWNVSNRSKNVLLSILRLVFSKAVEWNYLTVSPVLGIKRLPESCKGSRALTPNELSGLWDGLTHWQKGVIRVMVYSGMRPGELSNLKWRDIDWEQNRLAVVADKNRKTKNRKTRFIPMSPDLREELEFLKDNLPVIGLKGGFDPRESHQREYVLCHPDGSRVREFKHAIFNAFKSKGITGVTPHGLRKTFCSMLARSKVHPRVAQELMGHADINLTMKVYTEIDDGQLREAVNALPTLYQMRRAKLTLVQGKK